MATFATLIAAALFLIGGTFMVCTSLIELAPKIGSIVALLVGGFAIVFGIAGVKFAMTVAS